MVKAHKVTLLFAKGVEGSGTVVALNICFDVSFFELVEQIHPALCFDSHWTVHVQGFIALTKVVLKVVFVRQSSAALAYFVNVAVNFFISLKSGIKQKRADPRNESLLTVV